MSPHDEPSVHLSALASHASTFGWTALDVEQLIRVVSA